MSMTSDPRKNDVPLRPNPTGVTGGESPMIGGDQNDNQTGNVDGHHYASTQELLDYGTPPLGGDGVMDLYPGLFFDQKGSKDEPDYQESLNYRPIPFGGGYTNAPGPGLISGINLDENAGAAAWVRLHDGYDANAPIMLSCRLLAGTSKELTFSEPIRYRFGIYVEVVTGSIDGTLYLYQLKVK